LVAPGRSGRRSFAAVGPSAPLLVGPSSPSSSSRLAAEGDKERRAIVLHHGFFGGRRVGGLNTFSIEYFRGVPADLRDHGYDVLVTEVPSTSSTKVRAEEFAEQVAAWPELAGRRVTILAHSMGGLDARYAISKLGLAPTVDTLLTIATPHRGSPVADMLLGFGDYTGLTGMVQVLPFKLLAEMPDGGRSLTVEASAAFNVEVIDAPEVQYLSVGGDRGSRTRTSPEVLATYMYIHSVEGPNDGLVSVSSATWGTYLETLDMDHLHQMNFPLPHRWLTSAPTYQDVVLMYRRLAGAAASPEELPAAAAARHGPPLPGRVAAGSPELGAGAP